MDVLGISLTAISPPCCGSNALQTREFKHFADPDFFELLVIEFRCDDL